MSLSNLSVLNKETFVSEHEIKGNNISTLDGGNLAMLLYVFNTAKIISILGTPFQMSLLPEGYKYTNFDYISTSKHAEVTKFECNELNTEEKIRYWARKFEEKSCVAWRVNKTYPQLKKIKCICNVGFRCQFGPSWYQVKLESHRKSKTMQCPAKMSVRMYVF